MLFDGEWFRGSISLAFGLLTMADTGKNRVWESVLPGPHGGHQFVLGQRKRPYQVTMVQSLVSFKEQIYVAL